MSECAGAEPARLGAGSVFPFRANPAEVIGGEAASGHDTVDVGMET